MPSSGSLRTFRQILTDAVNDLAEHGYQDREQIDAWLRLLRTAAERELGSESRIDLETRAALDFIYRRLIEGGQVTKYVPGVNRFTLAIVRPELRAELDRRILAAASLIKLNRAEAIESTLRRFEGWSTAIPPGGEGAIDKRQARVHIASSLQDEKFRRNRVNIDQGAKLQANICDIVAVGNGAIAAIWNHVKFRGKFDRKEHLARDGLYFAIRDSWAWEQGLIKKSWPTTSDVDPPAFLPLCRCSYTYVLSPRRLPDSMLTLKGLRFVSEGGEKAA